ncbi:DUF4268 domain-containing protein [Halorubrum sp. Ib24]|uniref:DUF4268 domain-containing protein n=1 Tax=Halorubrum sp. Ib24 TaxID=1383850 RepID=UPI00130317E4|nr:DUF4268 domain-containing protein [Halorubrum sp. Ib24]
MDVPKAIRKTPNAIWEKELEFTEWLDENIDRLNETLGTSFTVTTREKQTPTGFQIDLVVEDEDERKDGIIECQFGSSDHDHLGKLITYSTAFDADIAVWVVREPRYEHEKAVQWLNESSDKDFYLVTIETVEVNGSEAPLFTPISTPSPVAKDIGDERADASERELLQEQFWEELLKKSNDRFTLFKTISPKQQGWLGKGGTGIGGVAYTYLIQNDRAGVELYIDSDSGERNEKIFDALRNQAAEIEDEFGSELDWQKLENKRACRIQKEVADSGLRDKEEWNRIQEEMVDAMVRFENAIGERVRDIS